MSTRRPRPVRRYAVAAAVAGVAFVGAACSSTETSTSSGSGGTTATTARAATTMMPGGASGTTMMSGGASGTTMAASGDIVATAQAAGDFTTLVQAVQAAGLVSALQAPGPLTVFAPTDAAFAKLPAGTLDTLLKPENKAQLEEILKYHVVSGEVMEADVVKLNGQEVETLAGQKLKVQVEGEKVFLIDGKDNKVAVVKTNIPATNGVIHVVDGVLLPPS